MKAMEAPESIGHFLRRERELRAVSLEEVAQTTRIPLRTLRLMEADAFDQLPGEVFVRGFIKSYAKTLGVEDAPVLYRYLVETDGPSDSPATLATVSVAHQRGRRFGVAIALVVLLILFTLALSIVLRPRHRDVPLELSAAPDPVAQLARV